MAWTLVTNQHTYVSSGGDATVVATALPSNPTTGNVVCAAVDYIAGGATTVVSATDENGKVYSSPANSPSTFDAGSGQVFLFYRICTGGEGKTLTVVFNDASTVFDSILVMEFAPPSGTPALDNSAKTTGSGTAINGPSIPVAGADDLLFAATTCSNTVVVWNGVWTGAPMFAAGVGDGGEGAGYDLSASSATAVNATGGDAGETWSCAGMSFTIAAAGTTVALTGVAGTAARGSVVADLSGLTMAGKVGTGAAGTQAPGISVPLVG